MRCPVGRVVINEDRLPTQAAKSNFKTIKERSDVAAFVEGRNYDC
jgi:hypothetical protein